ncbi:hypothetical protein ACLESO_51985 [Pyxidicoccus sp. 3LG]
MPTGMNDLKNRRLPTAWPLALLLLSLTACDPKDEDDEESTTDPIRVKYGETWRDFDKERTASLTGVTPRTLRLCGVNDPIPEAIDDETSVCLLINLDESLLGTGPGTLTLEGTSTVTVEDSTEPSFAAGPGHSQGVGAVWASTGCFGPPSTESSVQQVNGRLVLEENSATQLKGRLELQVTGKLAGRCPGTDAEADVEFDVAR